MWGGEVLVPDVCLELYVYTEVEHTAGKVVGYGILVVLRDGGM